ncbi:hypothetical protein [Rubrivirga sp. IMCC43871]|uniref:hypothetical protein n=1 Tax=Rubrivirga sp. IMCC43871 TaxID=3391575 RepID=UPI00398FF78D
MHYVDATIDTGDPVAQREVPVEPETDTLATTYRRLHHAIQALFREPWPAIRAGTCQRTPRPAGGSVHRVADRASVEHLLTKGWDTRVSDLIEQGQGGLHSP